MSQQELQRAPSPVPPGEAPAGPRRRSGGSPLRALLGRRGTAWLLVVPVAFLLGFFVVPLIAIFIKAFSEGDSTIGSVLTDPVFLAALRRTLVLAVVVTVVSWLLAVPYALSLMVAPNWLRLVLFSVLLISFWVSLVARTYGWVIILQPRGVLYDVLARVGLAHEPIDLLQTTPAMYPAMIQIMVPYMVLPIYAGIKMIDPYSLIAARAMGASPLRILRSVVMPQLRGSSAAGATIVFIMSLGFFVTPAFLGGPSELTLGTVIQRAFSDLYDFKAASIMGAGLMMAVTVIYLIADRYFDLTAQYGLDRQDREH